MICILIAVNFSLSAQSKKIKVTLVQYIPYCGGAKPTAEIIKSAEKPVAYANKKLIYISDKQKTDTIITDKSGNIVKTLPYGTYKFFTPWKFYKTVPPGTKENNLQMDCLKEEWVKEDLKITVSKKITVDVNNLKYPACLHKFPCLINKHLPR
ncbi:MAG: hypothetical protein H7141_11215 [Burkholderiales bacterium]|nr:hypothetical protein [Bacteroidia bacterium]